MELPIPLASSGSFLPPNKTKTIRPTIKSSVVPIPLNMQNHPRFQTRSSKSRRSLKKLSVSILNLFFKDCQHLTNYVYLCIKLHSIIYAKRAIFRDQIS